MAGVQFLKNANDFIFPPVFRWPTSLQTVLPCSVVTGTRWRTRWEVIGTLPAKGNSNSHGARPVHLIITMIQWIRTSRLSIKNFLSNWDAMASAGCCRTWLPASPSCSSAPSRPPYTLHASPCSLHSTPHTLHPTPYTLHPTPYTLHPTPRALHPTPYTLHPTPYTLHPTPYTLVNTFCAAGVATSCPDFSSSPSLSDPS